MNARRNLFFPIQVNKDKCSFNIDPDTISEYLVLFETEISNISIFSVLKCENLVQFFVDFDLN